MKQSELIFVPAPGVGHLVSTIEFGKNLIKHDDQLFITILVMKLPIASFVDAYTRSLTASQPNIKLVDLPQVDLPSEELYKKSVEGYVVDLIERYKPHVRNSVNDIISSRTNSDSVPVSGVVLDFFCGSMIDVGDELGLPSFIFFTSGSGFLNFLLYLAHRHGKIESEFKFSDPDVSIPGFVNSVPVSVLPDAAFNTHGGYDAFLNVGRRFKDARGIFINTFAELEPYDIEFFNSDRTPKVYRVGPVLHLQGQPHPDMDHTRWKKIMAWLDEQPESSVVFLCFGSAGSFSVSKVKGLALGLEQCGHKFLWSLRVPPIQDEGTQIFNKPEEMLPEGFLERVEGRGVVCGWAPQTEVLAHKAIGGFVSHCGWNSILESLWYGVPIATLPIYAEQQLNAFKMVKEFGLAIELKIDNRTYGDGASAEEVQNAVKSLMESGSEVKKKVKDMARMARSTAIEGGSSFNSILQFITDLRGGSFT